ncbi:MAG: response regulator [Calditrichaeota bacterium]|nr:MAG: response regulator [Calditrichota bacterium]
MGKIILVVDDSRSVAQFVRDVLESRGYKVLTATDGMEALTQLFKYDVDLIIAEADMPGLNGVELVKAVRKTRKYQNVPVILVSSSGKPPVPQEQPPTEKANVFLRKPFDRKQIEKEVEKLVN